ncbi:hypothetical protein Patl1_07233 [Pistacia atlantica]|uniref:Uncharacterized protein n=1 Tax=Pistacia atlantica TaxID=434234 RepID=A0ACC1AGI3_9ROSI|nr:hypothetical protein Patl1_07233 [Pistacia atlantica]
MSNTKHLATLKVLDLNGCSKLDKLPEDLGHLARLENLDLGGTAISQLPSSIVLLKNLEQLSFHGCKGEARKSWSSLASWFPLFSRANPESGLKCGITRSDFEIIFPGSQVPDWFIHQSEGSSISISQPMPTCSGLALCAAFSLHHPKGFYQEQWMNLHCDVKVNDTPAHAVLKTLLDKQRTHTVSMSVPLQTLAGTDHLWYESHEGFTIKVKECGLRPVYDSDIEEFIRASNNLSSNTSPEVLDPDRLAVTSTIISEAVITALISSRIQKD